MTKDEYRTFVMTATGLMTKYGGDDFSSKDIGKHVAAVARMAVWCANEEHGEEFAEELHKAILTRSLTDLQKAVEALLEQEEEK